MIDHIIWDWNGTLFDDVAACIGTINIMLKKRSLPLVDIRFYRDVFDFPVQNFYRQTGFDFNLEDWGSVAEEYHCLYLKEATGMSLRSGVRATLEGINHSGISMSVLSASEQVILSGLVRSKNIEEFFMNIRGLSDLHAVSKVMVGRQLLSDLDVNPQDVLLIGDTTHDYEVACALGCQCLLLAGGHQSEGRLRACSCLQASDMDDVMKLICS